MYPSPPRRNPALEYELRGRPQGSKYTQSGLNAVPCVGGGLEWQRASRVSEVILVLEHVTVDFDKEE